MTLTEQDLEACAYSVRDVIMRRRRTGQPVPEWLRRAQQRLVDALETMSADGPAEESTGSDSRWIGTAEAGALLGSGARQIRRLAADLDGRRVGRQWVFDSRLVTEYAVARRDRT